MSVSLSACVVVCLYLCVYVCVIMCVYVGVYVSLRRCVGLSVYQYVFAFLVMCAYVGFDKAHQNPNHGPWMGTVGNLPICMILLKDVWLINILLAPLFAPVGLCN